MTSYRYEAIGPDRPLGDRDDGDDNWSPEEIEQVSNEEVKNPADGPEETPPDESNGN
jgi:hypothetical protein